HDDAVHEGDVGFWKFGDASVENVFFSPQHLAKVAGDLRTLVKRADVATRAKAAVTGAFEHDHGHVWIGLEPVERLVDVEKHFQRHGIDRLRPIQPDDAGMALAARDQVGLGNDCRLGHLAPSIILRATISRMISLVPSRIWCTRKSRTIFSTPYSLR